MRKWLPIVLLCCGHLLADKYDGPRPPKPDLPYLIHADNLIPTESVEAQQEDRKGDVAYAIPGANSPVRTPLASPAFLILTDQLQADHLQLYRLQSKGGQREVLVRRKKKLVAHPVRLNVKRLDENLYKIEVDEILENGEYSLSPVDSNQTFCFEIY
jgi:hypothetical protein